MKWNIEIKMNDINSNIAKRPCLRVRSEGPEAADPPGSVRRRGRGRPGQPGGGAGGHGHT